MRVIATLLAFLFAATPALAQQPRQPIHASIQKAAAAVAAEQRVDGHRGKLFWPGLALGVAGVTTAVLGVTVDRVENRGTGNAPASSYQACIAQKSDPIYATNNCDALKGRNQKLVWTGVTVGALGAVMMIGSAHTSAELTAGGIALRHSVRF